MELAAAGEDLKKLREIARVHIEKAAGGDMRAPRARLISPNGGSSLASRARAGRVSA